MKPTTSLRKALNDKQLLGHVLSGDSWKTWRILLIAAMGEGLTEAERAVFKAITGRDREPGAARQPSVERSSVAAAARRERWRQLATYISALVIIATRWRQARPAFCCPGSKSAHRRKILDFCDEDFNQPPILRQLVVRRPPKRLSYRTTSASRCGRHLPQTEQAQPNRNHRRRVGILVHGGQLVNV